MYDFTNVDPVKCCAWLVLPTVYDESLSYGEQLNKFCKALNELIENNNNLPDYVAEMIQNYITSGAIDEVIRNVLANYILNVKYPPKGITPAVGDGSADDTDAIQGCIDYAFNKGGGCVYFPYGKYLTRSLTLRSGVSLVGFDRYSTKIVQRGGDTKPLVSGDNIQNVQISNLTLDGNNEVQTDDLDVVNVLGKDCLFTNLVIKSGFQCFAYNGLGGDLQVDNVVFGGAVKKVAVINGKDSVQFTNVKFNELGKVQGECVLEVGASDGVYSFSSKAISPLCISVNGSRNTFNCDIINASSNFNDTGAMNNFNVLGMEVKEQLAQGKNISIGGNTTENITGSKTETVGSGKVENITGNKTEVISENKSENITGNREIDIDGTDSIHVDGVSSVNIGGTRTEVYGSSRSIGVAGVNTEEYHNTMNETFDSNHVVNGTDEANNFTGNVTNIANKFSFNSKEKSLPVEFPNKIIDLYNLSQFYANIMDYNAKGDGVTDDSNALLEAINENGYVYLPYKHNFLFSQIDLSKCKCLLNLGFVTGLIAENFSGVISSGVFESLSIVNSNNFSVKDIIINSNNNNGHYLYIDNCKNFTLDTIDCKGKYCSGNNIQLYKSFNGCISNIRTKDGIFENNKKHGLQIRECEYININNCIVNNCTWFGYSIEYSSHNILSNCYSFDSNAEGVNIECGNNNLIDSNYFFWNENISDDYGISVLGRANAFANANTISNNIIIRCAQSGIAFEGNSHINKAIHNTLLAPNSKNKIKLNVFSSTTNDNDVDTFGKPGKNYFVNNYIYNGTYTNGLTEENNLSEKNYYIQNILTNSVAIGTTKLNSEVIACNTDFNYLNLTLDGVTLSTSLYYWVSFNQYIIYLTGVCNTANTYTINLPVDSTSVGSVITRYDDDSTTSGNVGLTDCLFNLKQGHFITNITVNVKN